MQPRRTIVSSRLPLYAYQRSRTRVAASFLTPLVFPRVYTKTPLRLVQCWFQYRRWDDLSRPSQEGTRLFPLDFASGREKGTFLPPSTALWHSLVISGWHR
ncbi:hypothetical protein ARMGADRAFT_592956 [Armillaria gallica]|uniref:Uncharacterized protein n=1 Tax=Armillaria gallica TaxID=47427 RepID=A0A2H3DA66_ARMGA|nr:hypothetical protein ARMGADRAFT_592956 [Armillaria gallica]